jgi:hypothetical protein
MAEHSAGPVYDPTGKNEPALPEPDPPTGTDIVPPDTEPERPGGPDTGPAHGRREGVVSDPD